MDCKVFRELNEKYSKSPLSQNIGETDKYLEWVEHLHCCQKCSDWLQAQEVVKRGKDISNFPCVHIAYRVTTTCEQHLDPFDCPDIIIIYDEAADEYGIPIRDGGHSVVKIVFCPWCGAELSKVKKTDW